MFLVLSGGDAVLALDFPPTETATPSVPKPLVLTPKETIRDSTNYPFPKPPRNYADRTPIQLDNDEETVPQGPALRELTDASTLGRIPAVNQDDRSRGKYYWHPSERWNYCHYREGDRQWYGWRTGEAFHWLLWRAGRFWWHDKDNQRWLYFDRGYWWWRDPKVPGQFLIILEDGHYHTCDANGVLGDDLMRTGTEEVFNAPVAKPSPEATPGTKHGGHHGKHHMDGGTGGDMPGGGMDGN
jgi:hypothetical protein